MPNHLINENSPYLLQHAHNPVEWYPWGEEALSKAKAENKPIFLSIGYAACHWCHVMAHESFENAETAALMNEHFINIKVDREERPDIDSIYIQAVVAMTGSGGWPMSMFLAPDLKPFYAGTYFPPVHRYNMPAFNEVLLSLVRTWKEERNEITKVGLQIQQHLQQQAQSTKYNPLTRTQLNAAAKSLADSYDWGYGGWGATPKFPQAMAIEFLLHHALTSPKNLVLESDGSLSENRADAGLQDALKMIKHCLHAMSRGGMYDVVGGGFARYSTDNFWRVPHFEKMLYDNALLARAYLHAWQVTKEPAFKRVATETLDFILREMTHPDGGFYSSLDADSEGEEGKFYAWTQDEIRSILKDDPGFFEAAYGISSQGNWEGKTVLQRTIDDASLAAHFHVDIETVPAKLAESHARLLSVRATRIRPGTDDKILTAWNGLMLATFAEAARVLDDGTYRQLAIHNANFLLSALRPDGQLRRAWREGKTTDVVFLEDYAALSLGLLELYQTDFDNKWFVAAKELADEMIVKFSDPAGGFFDTPNDGEALLIRPKDIQDNATPSGNALACEALIKLAAFTDDGKYRDLAEQSLALVSNLSMQYPLGFARWLSAAENALINAKQIAVLGEPRDEMFALMINVIHSEYRPGVVVATSTFPPSNDAPALLRDRPLVNGKVTAYICEGFVCKLPAIDIETFKAQLKA